MAHDYLLELWKNDTVAMKKIIHSPILVLNKNLVSIIAELSDRSGIVNSRERQYGL